MLEGLKPTAHWNEDYLQDEVLSLAHGNEHDWVEFKGSRVLDDLSGLRNEMGKQLSAFGNAGGGHVVIGIEERDRSGNPHALEIDGGAALDVKGGTKEWLDRVLPGLTEEPTTTFNAYGIRSNGSPSSKIQEGKAVFVIEVPPHTNAPVQAVFDKKFYLRIGGQSPPMSKQQIWDIANRQKHARVEVGAVRLEPVRVEDYEGFDSRPVAFAYQIVVSLVNRSKIMARYIGLDVLLPECVDVDNPERTEAIRPCESGMQGPYYRYFFHLKGPLFPGQARQFHVCRVDVQTRHLSDMTLRNNDNIGIAVYADHAPPGTWQNTLSEIGYLKNHIMEVLGSQTYFSVHTGSCQPVDPHAFWDTPNGDPDFRTENYV